MKTRISISIVLSLLMAMVMAVAVAATSVSSTRLNYIPSNGSDAYAYQSAQNVNSSTWSATLTSKMIAPQTNINVIGRRSHTLKEYCDFLLVRIHQYAGAVNNNYWFYSKTNPVTKEPCSGDRFGQSLGQHDFNHTGANGSCGGPSTYWCPNLQTSWQSIP